jgi:serine/threonine protein phosphatase PrpC
MPYMFLSAFEQNLFNWLMRTTTSSAVRRLAELPVSIATDIGLARPDNQDRAVVVRIQLIESHSSTIVVLCDGMGGMSDGAICACLAITTFLWNCIQNNQVPLQDRLMAAIDKANEVVFERYRSKGGTTFSAFIIDSLEGALGINTGDSRIYSIRDYKLSQLTVDDTVAEQFASYEELQGRNELLQYIGMGQNFSPHLITFDTNTMLPDLFLTSDGLHFLDKKLIQAVIKQAPNSAVALQQLIDLAKWHGGQDNASGVFTSNLPALLTPRAKNASFPVKIWDAFGELEVPHFYLLEPERKSAVTKKRITAKKPRRNLKHASKSTSPAVLLLKIKGQTATPAGTRDFFRYLIWGNQPKVSGCKSANTRQSLKTACCRSSATTLTLAPPPKEK